MEEEPSEGVLCICEIHPVCFEGKRSSDTWKAMEQQLEMVTLRTAAAQSFVTCSFCKQLCGGHPMALPGSQLCSVPFSTALSSAFCLNEGHINTSTLMRVDTATLICGAVSLCCSGCIPAPPALRAVGCNSIWGLWLSWQRIRPQKAEDTMVTAPFLWHYRSCSFNQGEITRVAPDLLLSRGFCCSRSICSL